jgi:hypothetical protein
MADRINVQNLKRGSGVCVVGRVGRRGTLFFSKLCRFKWFYYYINNKYRYFQYIKIYSRDLSILQVKFYRKSKKIYFRLKFGLLNTINTCLVG